MNQPIKGYTVYIMSQDGSCICHFGIDGTSKKKVYKMAREIAASIQNYYKTYLWDLGKVSAKVEEYKPHSLT